jgi:hypothetical protein
MKGLFIQGLVVSCSAPPTLKSVAAALGVPATPRSIWSTRWRGTPRGALHEARIKANDPNATAFVYTVP